MRWFGRLFERKRWHRVLMAQPDGKAIEIGKVQCRPSEARDALSSVVVNWAWKAGRFDKGDPLKGNFCIEMMP